MSLLPPEHRFLASCLPWLPHCYYRCCPLPSPTLLPPPPPPTSGATKLRRQVETTHRQHRANGRAAGLAPLLAAVGRVAAPAALVRDINTSVDEEGRVQDSASEQVWGAGTHNVWRGG
jgi:hypothetical protein